MRRFAVYLGVMSLGFVGAFHPAHAAFPGLNVGVHAGGILLTGQHEFINQIGLIDKESGKGFGSLFGAQLGYVVEVAPKTIVGFTVSASKLSVSRTNNLVNATTMATEGTVTITQSNALGAGLIAGLLINPRVSIYAYLGGETSKYVFQYSNLTFQTSGGNQQMFNITVKSFVPGAGIGLLISPKLYAAVEYQYPLAHVQHLRTNLQTINGAQRGYNFKAVEHRLLLRFGLRFGG